MAVNFEWSPRIGQLNFVKFDLVVSFLYVISPEDNIEWMEVDAFCLYPNLKYDLDLHFDATWPADMQLKHRFISISRLHRLALSRPLCIYWSNVHKYSRHKYSSVGVVSLSCNFDYSCVLYILGFANRDNSLWFYVGYHRFFRVRIDFFRC